MKATTLILSVISAASADKFIAGPPGWAQSIGLNVTEPEEHRLESRQARSSGSKVVLKNRTPHIKGSKSVKLRYGPFTIKGGGPYVVS